MLSIRSQVACLATTLLLGGAPEAAAKCTLGFVTALPMRYVNNRLIVDITIGGQSVPMILDTGSNISMLSRPTAHRVDVRVSPDTGSRFSSAYVTGIGGEREGAMMYAPHVTIGDVSAPDMRFIVPDSPGHDPDLLGMNPLAGFDIDLDLLGHRLVLFKNEGGCHAPPVMMGTPIYVVPQAGERIDTHTYLTVVIAGRTLRALLDTGAPDTLLSQRTADRVGLTSLILAGDRRFTVSGIGTDKVGAVRHIVAPMTIGGLTVQNVRAAILDDMQGDYDMLLGMDFLSRVHTWISNSTRSVIFQVPPTASPPLP